jgi:hypothetical protein
MLKRMRGIKFIESTSGLSMDTQALLGLNQQQYEQLNCGTRAGFCIWFYIKTKEMTTRDLLSTPWKLAPPPFYPTFVPHNIFKIRALVPVYSKGGYSVSLRNQ